MKRLSWITTMLLLANASLVLWGVHLWRNGQTRVHEPEHLAPQKWRQPDSTALAHSTRAPMDLTAVRDGAVFYASRHFHVAPPPTQTLTPPPAYELTGVFGFSAEKRAAILHHTTDQASRRVHLGDDLEGWQVRDIDVTRVLITRDGQTYEIRAGGPLVSPQVLPGVLSPRVAQAAIPTNPTSGPGGTVTRPLGGAVSASPRPPGASASKGPVSLMYRPPPR